MNIFDIIGPIMIGPASSHTAGAIAIKSQLGGLANTKTAKNINIQK